MRFGVKTDVGIKRELNEDNFLILGSKDYLLCCVADGMGGHNSGEVASGLAVKCIKKFNKKNKFNNVMVDLKECMEYVNFAIFKHSIENKENFGMGTTLTLSVIKENSINIAHIGDSRAYLLKDNDIIKLTQDHSYVAELVKMGVIDEEEAKVHPKKNQITKAVGTEKNIEPDILSFPYEDGATLLLCTDGLINHVDEEIILDTITKCDDIQIAVDKLVDTANENGGSDNITLIAIKL